MKRFLEFLKNKNFVEDQNNTQPILTTQQINNVMTTTYRSMTPEAQQVFYPIISSMNPNLARTLKPQQQNVPQKTNTNQQQTNTNQQQNLAPGQVKR